MSLRGVLATNQPKTKLSRAKASGKPLASGCAIRFNRFSARGWSVFGGLRTL